MLSYSSERDSYPRYSTGRKTVLVIDYSSVLVKLQAFLRTLDWISQEDIDTLFESLLMSYFSQVSDKPNKLLYNLLTDNGFVHDYQEMRNAEVALEIIEEIDVITRLHLPGPHGLGNMLHHEIIISDAYLRRKYLAVLELPEHSAQRLQEFTDTKEGTR